MKKTLNAFIKQSPQSKKSETFVDNNPQARSNPYEPEMSIREGDELQEGPVWDATKKYGGHAIRGTSVASVAGSAYSGATKEPNASTNRKIANTIDSTMSGNSGEVIASSRAASAKTLQTAQRAAGVVAPSMRVRANAGAAKEAQRVATRAAEIAANKAAGRAVVKTGLRAAGAVASKFALPIAGAMAAYDAVKGYTAQPNAPFSRKLRNAAQNAASGFTFGAVPAPQGVNEVYGLVLKGIQKLAPIAKRATAALEKKVATKAAQTDGSNVVKLVPKAAPPKVSVSTPRDATVLNMPKTTIGRAIVKAKAAKPATPATPNGVQAKALNTTGKIKRAFTSDTARQSGAAVATQFGIDAATPNFNTPAGQDPSMTPKGFSTPTAAAAGTAALLAGKNPAAWKRGGKAGAVFGAAMQGFNYWNAKDAMSTPEYKKADADWREYYRKTGQQPK